VIFNAITMTSGDITKQTEVFLNPKLDDSGTLDMESICPNNHPQIVEEGVPNKIAFETFFFTMTLPKFCDSEDASATLATNVVQADGSALPAWLVFVPATKVLSGIPSAGSTKIYSLKYIATDSGGETGSFVF
jgi:hypothetical protein